MKNSKTIIVAAIVSLLFSAINAMGAIPDSERAALIALYNSTNGDGWLNNAGWKGNNPEPDGFSEVGSEGTWYGVTVNGDHIIYICLISNQLTGTIPPELGNLTSLQTLYLDHNQLTGTIPPELGNLTNLTDLYLYSNRLTGTIPPELGNLTYLTTLRLYYNQLTGTIPPELGNLTSLHTLYLSFNQLTGTIPPELGNLTNLTDLFLGSNLLSGSIPPELGNLTNLHSLPLNDNQLTGSIPPEIGNLTDLTSLFLFSNQLTGSIPPELGNLTSLHTLSLSSNQLTDTIPPELGNLTSLIYLSLSSNQLTGTIPPELGNLTHLTSSLDLSFNQLTGSIPHELGNLTSLVCVRINDNHLSGAVPSTITNLVNLFYNSSDFCENRLFTDDTAIREFLNLRQLGGDWESCQERCPLGEWNFENTYDDTSGSEYHLNPYGTVPFVLGVSGGMAADFSGGSTTYPMVPGSIDVLDSADSPGGWPDVASFNDAGLSIMGWLRPESLSVTNTIISQDCSSVSSSDFGYQLGINADGALIFMMRDSFDKRLMGISQALIPINEWTHFAVTWDGNYFGGINMYLNGSLVPTDTFESGFTGMDGDSVSLYIGASHGDSGQNVYGFDGQLDNLSLWDGVLTAQEIAANHHTDTDGDGIFDDGDDSGIIGDNPCSAGNRAGCDDNCIDNSNSDQADTDGDGIGNVCDMVDLAVFAAAFGSNDCGSDCGPADFEPDDDVDGADLVKLAQELSVH